MLTYSARKSLTAGAFGREDAFTHRAQLDRAVEGVAFGGGCDADVHRLAVFHRRPGELHLVAVDAALDRRLAVLRREVAGQAGTLLRHVERELGASAAGGGERHGPLAREVHLCRDGGGGECECEEHGTRRGSDHLSLIPPC